jgi:hypothetical protein
LRHSRAFSSASSLRIVETPPQQPTRDPLEQIFEESYL